MERVSVKDVMAKIGEKVTVSGWVHARRDMGKIIFIDLRDRSGMLQVVFAQDQKDILKKADTLRSEFVVAVTGTVQKRNEKQINPKLETGTVELLASELEILNSAKTPQFEIDKDTSAVNEETRLKYRYLDLRSERMRKNLELRHNVIQFFRNHFGERGFLEIETPILTKGTPEGAREYLVPSRLHPTNFYVLPQSPQQFKQLLMVAGLERYMQIARCFRDEDQRGDRQPEFTQLDLEMSFVEQEEVLALIEEALAALIQKIKPGARFVTPFPRLSYDEAMKKHKTDKPDLRKDKNDPNELAFAWIVDFPMFEYSEREKKLVAAHHPFTSPVREEWYKFKEKDPLKIHAYAYDIVLNGYEIGGGSIRIHERELQNEMFKVLGLSDDEITKKFGHMLGAFEYGAPPHGGIALGLDRLIMLLAGESSIREVIPFPKTGDARDPLMGAPSPVDPSVLVEAHIQVINKK